MSEANTIDHRGVRRALKNAIPPSVFRAITVAANTALKYVPYEIKYSFGSALRRKKMPYSLIEPTDVVVQFGAPRDILLAGRGRGIHFARLASKGKVVIVEPEPASCREMKKFLRANKLNHVQLFEYGAWSEPGELMFLSNPDHPASNVLVDANEDTEELTRGRHFDKIRVPVETGDNILERAGVGRPKLISITTNGAELHILQGLKKTLASGVPYVTLALTGKGYVEAMEGYGYSLVALDDRGFTFKSNAAA